MWIINLTNGNTLVLYDMEGVNNQDRLDLSVMLALVSQFCNHMLFMDQQMNDVFLNTLGRLVGSRMVNVEAGPVVWPSLHVILNQTRLAVTADTLTQRFNRGEPFYEDDEGQPTQYTGVPFYARDRSRDNSRMNDSFYTTARRPHLFNKFIVIIIIISC